MNDARDKLNLHFSMLGLKGAPFFYFPVFQHFIIYNHSLIQSWTSLNIFETNL
ncbi:unnamed protein product [Brassica rapa subsp. narinosa]